MDGEPPQKADSAFSQTSPPPAPTVDHMTKKTFEQLTKEYVDAAEALAAYMRSTGASLDRGGETLHVDIARFDELAAAADAAQKAWHDAFHDPSVR